MEDENIQRIFTSIDLIRERVDSARIEPKFTEEIKKRNQRNPDIIQDDSDVLRRFAILIAFSQNAPSDLVSDMLNEGIFEGVFHNFEIDKVVKMDPDTVIACYWDKIKVIRFKKKIASIIGCAKSLRLIKLKHGSFKVLLNTLPINLKSKVDIERFWQGFRHIKNELEKVNMPFFKQSTSLLHFLLHIGYDCIKPDIVVMKVAKKLGIVYAESEKEKLQVVRTVQIYSVVQDIRPSIADFYLLICGGQRWAKQFVNPSFYERNKSGDFT